MPRWLRIIRGMIGTGLTFALGVGVVCTVGGLIALAFGEVTAQELKAIIGMPSVVAFIVGVAFSGVLVLTARGRSFDKLTIHFVAALGAAVGLAYFLAIGINARHVWSVADALTNLVVLTLIGGVSASAMLFLARKARHALKSGEELDSLGEGSVEDVLVRQKAEATPRR